MEIKHEIKNFWGRRNVSEMKTDVSDILVKVPGTDLRFALKILDNFEESLKEYKAKLASVIQLRGAPKVPLVIASLTSQQLVSLGVIVRWQFGTPVLEDRTDFISMTENNRDRIYDEIKASDETIRMLEITNCKVVKHLKISESFNERLFFGEIVYLRDLSIGYRMKTKDNLSDIERFEYYLRGIPEEDYPFDKLDEGIVNAIKVEGYKIEKVDSRLLLFSSELSDFKNAYYNKPSKAVEFLVLPDYSSVHLMVGKNVKPFYLDLFVDFKNQFTFQRTHFTIDISLNNVKEYYDFMDGTKTLCSISQFLNK